MVNLPLKYKAIMRRGFISAVVVIVLTIITVIISGGLLAWKTSYLDRYLPSQIKELFGKSPSKTNGAPNTSDTTVPGSQGSESNSEDVTKDWKTYSNTEIGFSFKYPEDWDQNVNASALLSLGSPNGNVLFFYKNFQGGREGPIRFEEKYFKILDGSSAYTTVYYGLNGDERSVIVDGTFYPKLTGIIFIYGFNLDSSANGLEILSLILSTLEIL